MVLGLSTTYHVLRSIKCGDKNMKELCDNCGCEINKLTGNKYDPLGLPSISEMKSGIYSGLVCCSCDKEIKKEMV